MKNSFFMILNLLSMLVFASLAILTPVYQYQKMIYLLAIFFIWFVLSCIVDHRWIKRSFPYILFLIAIILLDYICGVVNNDAYTMMDGVNKAPVFCWSLIGLFYTRHLENVKPIYLWILITFLVISSAFTISGNIVFPGASRLLAGTDDFYSEDRSFLRNLFVGGYDFIYCLVFLIYPLLIWSKNNNAINKFLDYALVALFFVTIVIGAYMIGILIAVLSILLRFVDMNRTSMIRLLVVILACFLLKGFFFGVLESIGEQYDIAALVRHTEELSEGSYSNESHQENNRIYIYWGSIHNWLQSPVFGYLVGKPANLLRAGHSEMLGFLERYGIFSIVYFLFFRRFYKDIKKAFFVSENKRYFKLYFLIFIVFGFLNRFDRFYGIGFMVFFMGPLLLLLKDFKDRESFHITSFSR